MLTLLNIGNSHAQIGIWSDGKMNMLPSIPTPELNLSHLSSEGKIVVASVVPEVTKRLAKGVDYFLSATNCGNFIDFSLADTTTLGADRVANSIAAAEFYPLPTLVVDCGTAITIEIIDRDRRFLGGAIAPGRKLMRKILYDGTAQLPEIPFSQVFPTHPGLCTSDAIRFGIDRGAVGLVRELITSVCSQHEIHTCLVTGGDAKFFAKAIPELIMTEPDFTLHGIRLAWLKMGGTL